MKQLFALLTAGLLACSTARPQAPSCATPGNDNAFLGIQTIRLWSGPAPQAKGETCDDIPALTVFDPVNGAPNGSAVVIFPGGSYSILVGNGEGREIADWFTERGFRAFVVASRLSSHGYLLPVPLLDAQRAIQLVRARALDYHIAPNRIVVIGFSGGGNLAALAATKFVPGNPADDDPIDRASSRPDYLVLGYPLIDAVSSDRYCKSFNVTEDRCKELIAAYSPRLFVGKDTPPAFIYHTLTDPRVPAQQSLDFYQALIKAGVPAELHIFANGPHGSGLGRGDPALDLWPGLLEAWLRAQGLLTVDKDAVGATP